MVSFNQLQRSLTSQRVTIGERINNVDSVLLTLDASVNETHSNEAEITEHPVETGSNITDHVRRRPETLEIEGVVSNKPIAVLASQTQRGIRGGPIETKDSDAHEEMRRWQDQGKLLTVMTTLRDYENMVVEGLSVTRDARNGDILRVVMRLREIILANTELVAAPDPVDPTDKAQADQGRKNTQASKPEVQKRTSSVLSDAANSLRTFVGF